MRRYFFEVFDGQAVPDPEGTEMADLAAARRVAVDILADRLKGSGEELWAEKAWRVQATDDTGSVQIMITVTVDKP